MEQLPLAKITVDDGLQPRVTLDTWAATDYCEAIRGGAKFPPLTVFFDGQTHWLADGFHRHYAYNLLGAKTVPVEIRKGTRRDALLFSCGANASHGLRRTNGDKRRAVERLLADDEWQRWSSRQIAKVAAVSHHYVEKVRVQVAGNGHDGVAATRLCQRGDQVFYHKVPRPRRASALRTRVRSQAASGNDGGNGDDEEAAETVKQQQQNLTRALEIIDGISRHAPAESFPVTARMRKHLEPVREWLNNLRA